MAAVNAMHTMHGCIGFTNAHLIVEEHGMPDTNAVSYAMQVAVLQSSRRTVGRSHACSSFDRCVLVQYYDTFGIVVPGTGLLGTGAS